MKPSSWPAGFFPPALDMVVNKIGGSKDSFVDEDPYSHITCSHDDVVAHVEKITEERYFAATSYMQADR